MSWFRFLRRPTRPIEPPLDRTMWSTEHWKPGDLGKCVVKPGPNGLCWWDPFHGSHPAGPKPGEIVRVTGLVAPDHLVLRGFPTGYAYAAKCFVKLDEKGEEAWLRAVRRKHAPNRQRETEDA